MRRRGEAVPEALCFGWIDSVSQRIDDRSRRQRWTPRKPNSNWSDVNIAHVERLIAEDIARQSGRAGGVAINPNRTGFADQLDDIMSAKVLRCGTFADVTPFAAPDPTTREMVGFDVDMCKAIAERWGVAAEIHPLSVEARA